MPNHNSGTTQFNLRVRDLFGFSLCIFPIYLLMVKLGIYSCILGVITYQILFRFRCDPLQLHGQIASAACLCDFISSLAVYGKTISTIFF